MCRTIEGLRVPLAGIGLEVYRPILPTTYIKKGPGNVTRTKAYRNQDSKLYMLHACGEQLRTYSPPPGSEGRNGPPGPPHNNIHLVVSQLARRPVKYIYRPIKNMA